MDEPRYQVGQHVHVYAYAILDLPDGLDEAYRDTDHLFPGIVTAVGQGPADHAPYEPVYSYDVEVTYPLPHEREFAWIDESDMESEAHACECKRCRLSDRPQ